VLKEIAAKLNQIIRDIDVLARFGGDEFVILLPYTKKHEALILAERIRTTIEKWTVAFNDPGPLILSVSIGLAEYVPGVDTVQNLIQKADTALSTAKWNGKNKVCSAD
jgi:diguanylate cyclase (GGDEF)-like protein